MTTIEDVLVDVKLLAEAEKTASKNREAAEKRLIAALAANGVTLKANDRIMIGNTLVSRPFEYCPLQIIVIPCVASNSSVPEGV